MWSATDLGRGQSGEYMYTIGVTARLGFYYYFGSLNPIYPLPILALSGRFSCDNALFGDPSDGKWLLQPPATVLCGIDI